MHESDPKPLEGTDFPKPIRRALAREGVELRERADGRGTFFELVENDEVLEQLRVATVATDLPICPVGHCDSVIDGLWTPDPNLFEILPCRHRVARHRVNDVLEATSTDVPRVATDGGTSTGGTDRCPECGRQITVGSSGVEYGHERGRGETGSKPRCSKRPESVDPSRPNPEHDEWCVPAATDREPVTDGGLPIGGVQGIGLDQNIGSILEAWLVRDTSPSQCRFCNDVLDEPAEVADRFCDDECAENWETVQEARLAIGARDLDQRGFD